jgi:hypothetical protein
MRNQKDIRQWWAENVSYKCDDVDHDVMPLEGIYESWDSFSPETGRGHGERSRTK